ncbi:hypothetical protein GCM10009727_04140 [Actinomadura napierensis]|uniref:Uncharacterized protein n=1 Tax=Actinomadura napierensis TaxID=267854 RepID=A0ABP5JT48_9ACTN
MTSRTVEAVRAAVAGAADAAGAWRVSGASATVPARAADTRRGVLRVMGKRLPHAGGTANVKKIRVTTP